MLRILFIFSFLFISCSKEKEYRRPSLSYLALGDSYTIGESIEIDGSYPYQLKEKIDLIDSLKIIAKTGWTTDELIDTLNNSKLNQYDIVSLLIGVNNQFRGYEINNYKVEFENLLNKAIRFSNNKKNIFVLSIPDYGVTPFIKSSGKEKIYNEINAYNDINRTLSEKYNIMYFNITDISRLAENDSSLLANDKLHPSKKMYNEWIDLIKAQILDSLKST
ncbi:MAG: lysophospholipase [Cytophagia bacterium]|jgi:lysophospholipase L1-like esterase|nr:lysophospholipase [Cytophagia bacterium]|tara:strand:+ start:2253 stop:2912 length:660 start_codon:yes stop_codon:yes gene_type:complete